MSPFDRIKTALGLGTPGLKPDPDNNLRPGGREHRALLAEMNADIPPGVDWTAGAQNYVAAEISKHGRDSYTHYLLSKPFGPVGSSEEGRGIALKTFTIFTISRMRSPCSTCRVAPLCWMWLAAVARFHSSSPA
jgi:hypothetical protein